MGQEMAEEVTIMAGSRQFRARLYETATARAIAAELPIHGRATRWGGEIYFPISIAAELESDAREVLEAGDLAFWPPGNMFCIFFGRTPASQGGEIRAASQVNVVGRIEGACDELWNVADGAEVSIQSISELES